MEFSIRTDVFAAAFLKFGVPVVLLVIEMAQNGNAVLRICVNRYQCDARQSRRGITAKLDPLLEVQQVKAQLVGAIVPQGAYNNVVEEIGLPRSRRASDEVVRRSVPDLDGKFVPPCYSVSARNTQFFGGRPTKQRFPGKNSDRKSVV